MARWKYAVVAAAIAPALALAAIACDDDDDDTAQGETTASQQSIDTLQARVQRNEMLFAVISLGGLGLHDMDEALNDEQTIDSSFAPNTRTAIRLLALTDWDSEFAADAEEVEGHAVDLLQALEDEDIDAAGDAAAALHDTEHDLSNAVWAVLAADLPPDAGGVEQEDHGEETPGAGETPASGTPSGTGTPRGGTPTAAATP